jgi:hypothetical protein
VGEEMIYAVVFFAGLVGGFVIGFAIRSEGIGGFLMNSHSANSNTKDSST